MTDNLKKLFNQYMFINKIRFQELESDIENKINRSIMYEKKQCEIELGKFIYTPTYTIREKKIITSKEPSELKEFNQSLDKWLEKYTKRDICVDKWEIRTFTPITRYVLKFYWHSECIKKKQEDRIRHYKRYY